MKIKASKWVLVLFFGIFVYGKAIAQTDSTQVSSPTQEAAVVQEASSVSGARVFPSVPNAGVPGFLDAEVAPKGNFVLELPLTSFDYGVTDKFTIGTNIGFTGLLALSGIAGGWGKARYKLIETERSQTSLTGYLGFTYGEAAKDPVPAQKRVENVFLLPYAVTLNTSFVLLPWLHLTGHGSVMGMRTSVTEKIGGKEIDTVTNLSFFYLGTGLNFLAGSSFSVQLDAGFSPYVLGSISSALADGSFGISPLSSGLLSGHARVQALLRTSPTSLWSFGLMAGSLLGESRLLPIIAWSKVL